MLVSMSMQQNYSPPHNAADTKSLSSMIQQQTTTSMEDCSKMKDYLLPRDDGNNHHHNDNHHNNNNNQTPGSLSASSVARRQQQVLTKTKSTSTSSYALPKKETSRLVSGIGLVDRDAFMDRFDMGVPLDATVQGNERVMILYSNELSFPISMHKHGLKSSTVGDGTDDTTTGTDTDTTTTTSTDDGPIRYISDVNEATENCDSVHIVLTSVRPHDKQCIALMVRTLCLIHISQFKFFARLPQGLPLPFVRIVLTNCV
jgi:hypothetical protein